MADNQKFYQLPAFVLAGAGCSIGDTSVTLSSMLDADGNQVQMTDLGAKSWITIEPGNSTQEEQISFTGITVNANNTVTLTGVKNVAFKSPYTETSGVLKTHPGGAKAIISNTSAFYDNIASKDNDETITGVYTFTQSPFVPTPNGLTSSEVASVGYVNAIAIAGAPKASSTVIGIAELSVDPVVASVPIALGQNDPVISRIPSVATQAALVGDSSSVMAVGSTNVFVTQQGFQRNQEVYAVASGTSTALAVALNPTPVALIAGMQISFKANGTCGNSPTLNVNSLGAKNLVKVIPSGTTVGVITNVTSVLAVGDIGTNTIVLAEYNGNEWQTLSSINNYTPWQYISSANFNGAPTQNVAVPSNANFAIVTANGTGTNVDANGSIVIARVGATSGTQGSKGQSADADVNVSASWSGNTIGVNGGSMTNVSGTIYFYT